MVDQGWNRYASGQINSSEEACWQEMLEEIDSAKARMRRIAVRWRSVRGLAFSKEYETLLEELRALG